MPEIAALAQAFVALMTQLLPTLEGAGASNLIESIVNTLISLIPVAVQWAQDLIPSIQNIITTLKSNAAVTPTQISTLEALEAQYDAAFQAAAAAAGDPAS